MRGGWFSGWLGHEARMPRRRSCEGTPRPTEAPHLTVCWYKLTGKNGTRILSPALRLQCRKSPAAQLQALPFVYSRLISQHPFHVAAVQLLQKNNLRSRQQQAFLWSLCGLILELDSIWIQMNQIRPLRPGTPLPSTGSGEQQRHPAAPGRMEPQPSYPGSGPP